MNLTDCVMDGADLANCNLDRATVTGVDFSKAKNYRAGPFRKGVVARR